VPAGKTVRGAYGFLFQNAGTVIGTVWLPLLLLAAVTAGVAWLVLGPALPVSAAHPLPMLAVIAVVFLGGCLAGSMVLARLTQHALGKRTRPTYAAVPLGRDVWRILPSFLLFDIVLTLMAFEADELASAAFTRTPPPVMAMAAGLACLVAIYVVLRALFLVPAVVAVEHRLGLTRSWSLCRRSFARLVIIALAIGVPTALLAKGLTLLAQLVFPTTAAQPSLSPAGLAPFIPIVVIAIIQRVLNLALIAGASASAYRSVVPEQ
jgi:hypothetical protein